MSVDPTPEPPIDMSLAHYVEERALAIALEKVVTHDQQVKVERLIALREELLIHRETFMKEAISKRHARGEIYSKARVAAINSLGPSKAELDADIKTRFGRRSDPLEVLKAHARVAFGFGLVSERLRMGAMTPDIADAARQMQKHEEQFAKAWIKEIRDAQFEVELRDRQRGALSLLRTAARPIYFVSKSAPDCLNEEDASELGKAWSKLDKLAELLEVQTPSQFVAFDVEGGTGDAPSSELLPVFDRLIIEIETPGAKFTGKKKVLTALRKVRKAILTAENYGGGGHFEVDI